MPNDKNINIKESIQNLSRKNNEKVQYHPTVYRPWGSFEVLLTKKNYQVKKLIINPKVISCREKKIDSVQKAECHWIIVGSKAKKHRIKKHFCSLKLKKFKIWK